MQLVKEKVFRDPIHRYITVGDVFIWKLINTGAFQRLNNLHQLGGSYQVFHGAVHTRFGHSLGVYAIAREMYEKVPNLAQSMTEYERKLLFAVALLHDLGHGPYSHASEAYLLLHHEEMTAKIIREDTEIRQILDGENPQMADDIIAILQKRYPNKLLSKIISSQIDVDRMDYLLRDSYYAGVPYGDYDKDRIIRVMRIIDQDIAFSETGIHVIENFMVSRYHMREQVYNNTKGRAFESLLKLSVYRFKMLQEAKALPEQKMYQLFTAFISSATTTPVTDFLIFDDHMFMATQQLLTLEDDEIIKQIAHDIVKRKLPQVFEIDDQILFDNITQKLIELRQRGNKYGFYLDADKDVESPLIKNNENDQIKIINEQQQFSHAETISPILAALQTEAKNTRYFIYINKSLLSDKMDTLEMILERINFFES